MIIGKGGNPNIISMTCCLICVLTDHQRSHSLVYMPVIILLPQSITVWKHDTRQATTTPQKLPGIYTECFARFCTALLSKWYIHNYPPTESDNIRIFPPHKPKLLFKLEICSPCSVKTSFLLRTILMKKRNAKKSHVNFYIFSRRFFVFTLFWNDVLYVVNRELKRANVIFNHGFNGNIKIQKSVKCFKLKSSR